VKNKNSPFSDRNSKIVELGHAALALRLKDDATLPQKCHQSGETEMFQQMELVFLPVAKVKKTPQKRRIFPISRRRETQKFKCFKPAARY